MKWCHNYVYELTQCSDTQIILLNTTVGGNFNGAHPVKDVNNITYKEFKKVTGNYKFGCLGGREIKPW